jgi:hypothetical protein
MTPPKIQALGVTQEGSPSRWRATGYVEGRDWLEARGISLITAMKALQALAAQRLAETDEGAKGEGSPPRQRSVTSDAFTDLATVKVSLAQAKESPPCLSNTSCCERRRRMVRLPA